MSTEFVDVALRVTTPLALLSLLATLVYSGLALRLKHREKTLDKLPEEQRATEIDEWLTRYQIDGKNLSREQRFSLIRDELDKRFRRSRELAILIAVVFVACFAMAVFAFVRRGDSKSGARGNGDVKGALRHVELQRTKVRARVANQGDSPFDVNAGSLEAECSGLKVNITLKLPKGASGLVESHREQAIELVAHYDGYPVIPPPADGCRRYVVTVVAATGDQERPLTLELARNQPTVSKERLTLFEFDGSPESRDAYVQYKDALRTAEPIAAGDIDLIELARAEMDQIPLTVDALDGIQKRSLSVALASGSVTKQGQDFQVRSSLFVGGVPREVRERLMNVRVLLGQDIGFYVARQLSEMALFYALARSAEKAKPANGLDYLAKARSTAASILSKPDLPPDVRAVAEAWQKFLTKCLEDRTAVC